MSGGAVDLHPQHIHHLPDHHAGAAVRLQQLRVSGILLSCNDFGYLLITLVNGLRRSPGPHPARAVRLHLALRYCRGYCAPSPSSPRAATFLPYPRSLPPEMLLRVTVGRSLGRCARLQICRSTRLWVVCRWAVTPARLPAS